MSDRTFGRNKASTSTFSNPSLVSPTTPTLANPLRGFGLQTNDVIQTATEESTNLEQAQAADEQSLLSEAIEQRSFGHDISRISLHRPQAKLTVGEADDQYEQEADWMANQVMRMVVPNKLNAPNVQPIQKSLLQRASTAKLIQLATEQNYTPASEEFNYTPGEDEAADIGQEALQTVGYQKIINTALEAGFIRTIDSDESATVQTKLQGNQDTIFRQAQAAMTAGQVFTRYAVAAGVASQVDSPVPGPGDVVAIGILIVGLAAAGYVLMASHGNVADTGIMEEVQRLIEAARAAGQALTICEALAQLMAAAERTRDSARLRRIKATQKYHGCRHSRHS